MSYHHFNTAARYKLNIYLDEGYSFAVIAKKLHCSRSSIWREVSRNSLTPQELANGHVYKRRGDIDAPNNRFYYDAEAANYKATRRRANANHTHRKLPKNTRIRNYIIKRLRQRWSPEQISGVLKKRGILVNGIRHDFSISPQTIYDFIYTERKDLKQYLRRKKKYKHCHTSYLRKQLREQARSIDARPKYIDKRLSLGHWEGDTIVGANQGTTGRIATFVERKSGYLLAVKIPAQTVKEKRLQRSTRELLGLTLSRKFADAFITLAKTSINPKYRKTLTLDNGSENADYECLERSLPGLTVYFAHPYHSWERGTNENTNGLLRQYFPKGMDFTNITQANIDKAVEEINNRPRKRLNWNTPRKVMERHRAVCTSK